jgi:ATP-binding cassette subfamily B protein
MKSEHYLNLKPLLSDNRFIGLWRLMKGYEWTYLVATLSLGIGTLARTGTYIWLQYFIDEVLGHNPTTSELLRVGLIFVGLALVLGGFNFLSGVLTARTAEGVARRLRNFLYDHMQHLHFTYHDQTPTGDLIQRSTSDVDAIRRFFADQAIGAGRILLFFFINFIAILRINTRLGWMSIIVIPATVTMSFLFFRQISKRYERYQEQEAKLSTTLQENLSGVRVVKAFARQPFERQKFEADNQEKYQRGRRLIFMHSLYWPVSDILSGLQTLIGLGIGAAMTIDGTISLGSYVAYSGMVLWIIWPMRNLGRWIVQMSTGLVSYGRVREVIRQTREPMEDGILQLDEPLRGEIRFDQVEFAYETSDKILKGISFAAQPGQSIALMGPTGSGKTSVVNLLPRFYDYTGGSITLDGRELQEYSRQFLRQQIGIVEQEPFLFSRTLRENIIYGVQREVTQEDVEDAARSAAIHDTIVGFPEGYDTLVGEKGVTLSGGQKQRVAIARTILKNPRILILDDSTSSVDTETEVEIRQALERLMHGRTTFIIAHRIQSVMSADLILVLKDGQIAQKGQHEALVNQEGIYRDIFMMQTRLELDLEQELAHASD